MGQNDCIFCKIVEGKIPCHRIFENSAVLAFLDIGPISEGHVLVIPKAHYERVDQCPPEIMAGIAGVLPSISGAIVEALGVPAFNILCNNGSEAGQVVKHIHFHLIPRRPNDKVFTQWPSFKYPDGKALELLKKINEKLGK